MAFVDIRVHRDIEHEAQKIIRSMKLLAEAIEGYHGYIMGCQQKMDDNYVAMLWAVTNLSDLISEKRPSHGLNLNDEHCTKFEEIINRAAFSPNNPYK